MVKIIPDLISEEIKSNAEKKLFFEFRNYVSNEKYIILHSLGLAEHVNNIFGEIDFVVICSRGILCIEVKGGMVSCLNGKWTFTNRYGKVNTKNEGPFQQVQGNMKSLRAYLLKHLDKNDSLVACQYASCVIMPDIEFLYRGIEIIPEILFDKKNYVDLSDAVHRSFDYWEYKLKEKYDHSGTSLSDEDMERLANLLRGDFRFVPSLRDTINNTDRALCSLTDEQYDILESLSDNERVIVSGVAGSGKTFLAMEQARRGYWTGKRVLYICFNKTLANYVKYVFDKEGIDIRVSTLHAFLANELEDNYIKNSYYYEKNLPEKYLARSFFEEYDFLIVDEGQDIFKEIYMKCMNKFVKGGLKEGHWFVLFDQNQNIYNDNKEMELCVSYLKKYATFFKLAINCRNTKQIAESNILMTGITKKGKSKVNGLKVDYISYTTQQEEKKILEEILIDLRNNGLYGNDIVMLSRFSLSNPQNCLYQSSLSRNAGILKTTGQMWLAKKNEVRFSTISSFKGLEANVVIIYDINSFSNQTARALNYVGISRACSKLYLLYNKECEDERQEMIINSYKNLK